MGREEYLTEENWQLPRKCEEMAMKTDFFHHIDAWP
jgi:hypothetical protein